MGGLLALSDALQPTGGLLVHGIGALEPCGSPVGNSRLLSLPRAPGLVRRAAEQGINPKDCLENNDAGSFFTLLDDLVTTGPTYTNVNDFRAIAYIPNSD